VSSAQPDLESLNNEASWTVDVLPAADVAVRVVGQTPELAGPSNLLQVVVTNLGPSLAGGVAVQGSAEDDWSGIQASPGIGTWEVGPEGGWIWELGDLGAGAGAVLDLTLDRSQLGDWTNRVVASALQADPDPGNNQATWITRIRLDADLGIAGSAAPDTVLQGGEVVLSLVLTNRGTNVAHEVSAVIALPDATEVVEVVVDAGVWTNEAGALQWRMDDLAVDVTRTLVATLRVHSAGGTTNRVQVTADEVDLMPEDNHLDWQLTVLPAADLLLQMSLGNGGEAHQCRTGDRVGSAGDGPVAGRS
jgi:hypothetical protein